MLNSLSTEGLETLSPDVIVAHILPYVNIAIRIIQSKDGRQFLFQTGMLFEEILHDPYPSSSSELFGYFSCDITRSIWMVFRSVTICVMMCDRSIPPPARFNMVSLQASTVRHLLLNDKKIGCEVDSFLMMKAMPALTSFCCWRASYPMVLSSETVHLRSLEFVHYNVRCPTNSTALSHVFVCDLRVMRQLTDLFLHACKTSSHFPIRMINRGPMLPPPLTTITWKSPEPMKETLLLLLLSCRTTLKTVDIYPTTLVPLMNFMSCGPFPCLLDSSVLRRRFEIELVMRDLKKETMELALAAVLTCFPAMHLTVWVTVPRDQE